MFLPFFSFLTLQLEPPKSHLGLRTQTVVWPVVRPYDPGPHKLALEDVDLSLKRGTFQGSCW